MKYNKIVVIGAGLMGSSLIWALRENKIAEEVIALVRLEEQIEALNEEGIKATHKYSDAEDADIIFIAASLKAYEEIFENLANANLKDGVIVCDLGSVKEKIVNMAAIKMPDINFVPAHPIAGSHLSGLGTMIKKLYFDKKLIITAPSNDASREVANIWSEIGMGVEFMDANLHDKTYAFVSHLVQKIAFHFMTSLREDLYDLKMEIDRSEFNKFTRLCDSDENMWADIFEFNKINLEVAESSYVQNLKKALFHVKQSEGRAEAVDKSEKFSEEGERKEYLCLAALISDSLQKTIKETPYEEYAGGAYQDLTAILTGEENYLDQIENHKDFLIKKLERFIKEFE